MSRINDMLEAAERATPGEWIRNSVNTAAISAPDGKIVADCLGGLCDGTNAGNNAALIVLANQAIPDIKRIVEWVEIASHDECCAMNYADGDKCSCGLSEIQSLIRSDK